MPTSSLGGWKIVGSFTAYSGTPFYVSGSSSSLQCIGCTQTADQIAPVKKLGGKGPGNPYYDPMSFRDPLFSFNAATPVYRPGTTGWGILRGPGYWRINPAIYKNFKIKEKVNAEFRAESTNFTNTPIWSNPSAGSASMRLNPDGSLNTLDRQSAPELHVHHGSVHGPRLPLRPAAGVLTIQPLSDGRGTVPATGPRPAGRA